MKLSEIQKMIKDFENSNLTELELTFEDTTIKLSKQQHQTQTVTPVVAPSPMYQQPQTDNEKQSNEKSDSTIGSPLVGTFYAASSPKSKPYVEVGTKVKKGDVLCLIEAMKIMNEITAPQDGTIVKVHVMNGQVVGINDALFDLE